MRPLFRLGLTGGIGAGKSTVAGLLAQLGATLIDADAIARQTTAAGGSAIEPIRRLFGPSFVTTAGALDRDAMRSRVFQDPSARQQLEAIVHPLVHQHIEAQAASALAQGCHWLVLDIPLLVESKRWPAQLDKVMVVDCSLETQVMRVMQRSGFAREEVMRIIATQATRAQRLAAADIVLFNENKSLSTLGHEVSSVVQYFGL